MEELNNNEVDVEVTTETKAEGTEEKITLTQAELDEMLLKSGDKRVSQAMKTLEKKQREAEKLRSMNADEQREYNLSQREAAILAKEIELQTLENKSEGLSILAQKGLDAKLIDFVLNEDASIMYDNIKTLEKCFKNSVRAEVEKRLASAAPKKSFASDGLTKEQFSKMSYAQRVALKQSDPDLYNILINT